MTCFPVSVHRHVSVRRYACLFTPSLQRVPWPPPPRWPCGSPPSTVQWVHTTALRPSPTPRLPLTPGTSAGCRFRSHRQRILLPAGQVRSGRVNHALVLSEETGALLCSWGTLWKRASGLRLRRPWRSLRLCSSPDSAFRWTNGVGAATMSRFRSCFLVARVLAVYASPHRSPGERQDSLPACSLGFGRAGLTPAGFR